MAGRRPDPKQGVHREFFKFLDTLRKKLRDKGRNRGKNIIKSDPFPDWMGESV